MNTRLTLWCLIATLFMLSACTTMPSLLHQRGSGSGPAGAEIWIMDDAGTQAKLITSGSLPQWIWGGRTHIAYLRTQNPCDPNFAKICGTLYVAQWDHANQSMVGQPTAVTGPDSGEHFAWSRDGQWIVFESFRDGNWEIYKVRRDGSVATNLTTNTSRDIQPAWTHNGAQNGKIAFVSNRTGNNDILVMHENGEAVVNLTKDIPDFNNQPDGGDDWRPMWASNADSIAFIGTHKAWGNYTPMIYLTRLSQPGSIIAVSGTAASNKLLGWEGSESIFYSANGIYRYDVKTKLSNLITAQYSATGEQFAINPKFLYIGTNNGIKAIEWHLTNKVSDVGFGINPDR